MTRHADEGTVTGVATSYWIGETLATAGHHRWQSTVFAAAAAGASASAALP